MINNLDTNKSVNKNENSNRKKTNNITTKNYLRTSDFRIFPELIQTFNEEGNTLTQMGNAMKNLIQRKTLQNKSQSKNHIIN